MLLEVDIDDFSVARGMNGGLVEMAVFKVWARECCLQGNLTIESVIYVVVRLQWVESSQVNLEVSKNVL